MRSILHVRIPSFLAEIERKRRPELAGRSLIVGEPKGNTSGVVVSASREVFKLGVVEGMTVRQAQRACPDAVVIMADYAVYRQVSAQFLDILVQYSPLVEPDTLGSAYLDVTASRVLFGDASEIAARISSEVRDRLDLPVSVGIAENKLQARVASSDMPGGTFCPEAFAALPVNVLDSITPGIEKRLGELGILTIGQLAKIPERLLVRQFGPVGRLMKRQSLGEDWCCVKAAYPPEVIIIEHMFDNLLAEPSEVEAFMSPMVHEALARLRKKSCLAGRVALRLQVAGRMLRACYPPVEDGWGEEDIFCFKSPTDSLAVILQALGKMLRRRMRPGMEVEGVRIVLSDLTPGAASQLSLIGDGEKRLRINRTIEHIRERFGERAILIASALVPTGRAGVLARIAA